MTGTMIAHSFVLDVQGFPFMAEYYFYYIAVCYDLALSHVTIDDISESMKAIVSKVSYSTLKIIDYAIDLINSFFADWNYIRIAFLWTPRTTFRVDG